MLDLCAQYRALFLLSAEELGKCNLAEAHLKLMEGIFTALKAAGLTLKPSKVYLGPREVKYRRHVLPSNDIRNGEDRIKTIFDTPNLYR